MNLIERFLAKVAERRISPLVVGDAMVDEYYQVTANRLSPEFPIPVLRSEKKTPDQALPGGAGNVVRQFKHFNSKVTLASIINGYTEQVYEECGIDTIPCYYDTDVCIPIKRRYYDQDFPLCRIDIEKPGYGDGAMGVFDTALELIGEYFDPELIILSDYNKGVLSDVNIRQKWIKLGFPTIVDPKTGPVESWSGCDVIKPNSAEALAMTGEKDWQKQAVKLRESGCKNVVITRGEKGVAGVDSSGEFFEIASQSKEKPRSVIGAGDCFLAVFSAAFAHGFTVPECARIAQRAGEAYICNIHNHPVTQWELMRQVDRVKAKYIAVPPRGERDFKLVFTNGCFDLGLNHHMRLLEFAKEQGDKLLVAINSDASVKRLKGEDRPILPLEQRMETIARLECVDFVCCFDEGDPARLIEAIRPDVLCKGGDYRAEDVIGREHAGTVVIFPYIHGISSSEIIARCRATS